MDQVHYQAHEMGRQHIYPVMGRDAPSTSIDGAHLEQGLLPEPEWKPGKKEYAVMLTLALISLMVALDATILVSVLPVSGQSLDPTKGLC
jgi:hypothetical protein